MGSTGVVEQGHRRNSGSRKRRQRRAGVGMVAVGTVVALATFAGGSSTAGAVVGGTATADVADGRVRAVAAPEAFDVATNTAPVAAPPENGTNTSGAVLAIAGPIAVTMGAGEATATRGPTALSATSSIANTSVSLFGGLVTAGTITSTVNCPLSPDAPTSSASAATVVIGDDAAVTLQETSAPDGDHTDSATGEITLVDPMFVGGTATVSVLAQTRAEADAMTANAFGLRLRFTVVTGTLVEGNVNLAGTSLGEIVLAETDCEIPTAPDVGAPTTVAPTTVAPTTVAPTTVAPTTVAPTTVAPTTVAPTTTRPVTIAPPPPSFPAGGQLPATGSSTTATSLIAVGLLLGGGTLIVGARRRGNA